MPYVNIKITREGATAEQKATLIREVTRLLAETLGKNPATTVVVIEEVDTDNWGIGGETVTVRRGREKKNKTKSRRVGRLIIAKAEPYVCCPKSGPYRVLREDFRLQLTKEIYDNH